MKLCLIGDGNSIHIKRWAQWFRGHGHEVQMISLTKLMGDSIDVFDKYHEVQPKTGLFAYIRKVPSIRRLVNSWKPDIVHGHYLTSAGFYASVSGGKKIVVSAWGSDIYKDSKDTLKNQCIKYAMNNCHLVMGDSEHIIKACKELSPDAKTAKVIFGVDTDKFQPRPEKHDRFRFMSIRQTAPVYNVDVIVKAFELADLDAELWVYKPSVECQDLFDYVKANKSLDDKVKWLCKSPYDDMPYLYNQCDVGISIPSWDSSSTAMLECMGCGVPVIASSIPQNDEWVINGFNGFLSMIDIHHLANQMAIAMKDNLEIMGERARESVIADGDYDTEMKYAEGLYLELLDENR